MTHKLFGTSVAALMVVALLLTVGSVVAVAQVVSSATGSGQIQVSGDLRTFTFNAETDGRRTFNSLRTNFACEFP